MTKLTIDYAKTMERIQAGIDQAQRMIDDGSKRLEDLERLRELVEADDPEALDHWDAYWAVIKKEN